MREYNHEKIEAKWQKRWNEQRLFATEQDPKKPKCYVLDMFPYPSGEGLHVGHPKGYIASDIYARYKHMTGHSVLHPMGWDAFGLPAEQFAIKNKVHPRVAVKKNTDHFKEQLAKIGFNYDWEREINTTDPKFYKWTQWIFLQMYKKGLAYESFEPINWCPSCQTGLANEDLVNGCCERCGTVVELKPMRQWTLRITAYADRMLQDLDALNWPQSIKESQRNWIGKSEGAEIEFALEHIPGQEDGKHKVKVFTTRPDTLFGATYLAISAELASKWLAVGWKASGDVQKFVEATLKEEKERAVDFADVVEKKGIDTGVVAINPANNEKIPVWIANYVLSGYGTGAIMAVPAHDERDFEFATTHALPIKQVVVPCADDSKNPPREEYDEVKRNTIIVHVRDKSTGKFALLNWHGTLEGITTAIMGGVEVGQTSEEAVLAEVKEEAGLHKTTITRKLRWVTAARYCASHKKQNRCAHTLSFLAEVENLDDQLMISTTEQGLHTLVWVDENKVLSSLTPDHQKQVWSLLNGHESALTGEGYLMDSGKFTGMESETAKKAITEFVGGKLTSQYRLKDWVFSRQRYWGEPIPIIHCEKCGVVPVPEADLPVMLPEVESYAPTGTGESPLADITDWVNTTCPICGGPGKRETNTMPQWAGSSWYYLRFIDPHNDTALVDKTKEQYWSPVDMYVGGAEHATRHLIYARFWHKFLFDIGVVNYPEPFARLQHVGLIMASDGRKMSKRYGNVINPDDIVKTFGADSLRIYEMFMGPFDQSIAWSTDNIMGARRFIERIWRLQERVSDDAVTDAPTATLLHQTIKKVGDDIEQFGFNTAIAQMMILSNQLEKLEAIPREVYEQTVRILAPFAPHVTEELWEILGHTTPLYKESWPPFDLAQLVLDTVTVAIQVNGKLRDTVEISRTMSREEVESIVFARPIVQKWLGGKSPRKVIYVPGKIVNIVV